MVDTLLTSAEAADRLLITRRRVRALIEANRLPAHRATPDELAALLTMGRISSIPKSGLWLIREQDLELLGDRRTGRPRKSRVEEVGDEENSQA
jgi:hypothetical protein